MSDLDLKMTFSKLEARLEALSGSPELPVQKALAYMSEIVGLVRADALVALEREGRFEEAAALYEMVAKAFEMAAQKIPEEDRQQVASLGDYWSLKASAARLTPRPTLEPTPPPSPYTEPHTDLVTGRLSQKIQRQGLDLATDESSPSAMVRPQQAMDLKKPGEVQAGYETEVRISSLPKQIEKETVKPQQFSRKKPGLDRDLEASRASGKGA